MTCFPTVEIYMRTLRGIFKTIERGGEQKSTEFKPRAHTTDRIEIPCATRSDAWRFRCRWAISVYMLDAISMFPLLLAADFISPTLHVIHDGKQTKFWCVKGDRSLLEAFECSTIWCTWWLVCNKKFNDLCENCEKSVGFLWKNCRRFVRWRTGLEIFKQRWT